MRTKALEKLFLVYHSDAVSPFGILIHEPYSLDSQCITVRHSADLRSYTSPDSKYCFASEAEANIRTRQILLAQIASRSVSCSLFYLWK